jgi:signal peptidase I
VAIGRLRWLVLALGLALAVRHWVWPPIVLTGESMVPTLHNLQIAGVNKLAYRFRPPCRGDVVLVNTGRELTAKRILGLPGEEIAMLDGPSMSMDAHSRSRMSECVVMPALLRAGWARISSWLPGTTG